MWESSCPAFIGTGVISLQSFFSGSGPNRGHYITIVKSHGFWLLFDDDIVEVGMLLRGENKCRQHHFPALFLCLGLAFAPMKKNPMHRVILVISKVNFSILVHLHYRSSMEKGKRTQGLDWHLRHGVLCPWSG